MFRVLMFVALLLLIPFQIKAQTNNVTILAATDMLTINNAKGSYPELATILKQTRQLKEPTFFLFGGGSIGPSSMSAFDRGAHIIDILNMLEPDVMSITKREFSYFENELSLRSYEAAFPFVSSNLSFSGVFKNFGGLHQYVIIEKGDVKLGVISIIDKSVVTDYLLKHVIVQEPLQAIESIANKLRKKGVDAVILMYSDDLPFITQLLEKKIIDISILSDSHLKLLPNGTNTSHPNNISLNDEGSVIEIDVQWRADKTNKPKVSWKKHKLLDYPADTYVKTRTLHYLKRLNRLLDENIGTFGSNVDTRFSIVRVKESSLANFITDSMKDFLKTDIAMINGGAIRGERKYQANEQITRRDITEELPFRAHLVKIEIPGNVLKQVVEHGLSKIEYRKGRFLHFSGAKVKFDSSAPVNERLKSLTIHGKPVEEDKIYSIATTDYLALGGDGFNMLADKNTMTLNMHTPPLLLDVIVNSVRSKREIAPMLEARLIDLSAENN